MYHKTFRDLRDYLKSIEFAYAILLDEIVEMEQAWWKRMKPNREYGKTIATRTFAAQEAVVRWFNHSTENDIYDRRLDVYHDDYREARPATLLIQRHSYLLAMILKQAVIEWQKEHEKEMVAQDGA